MDLFLVRHGECGTGSNDEHLTEVGRWQAERLGERLSKVAVTEVVCSPMLRALETAATISRQLGKPCEVWPELREGLWEPYQGPERSTLEALFPEVVFPHDMPQNGYSFEVDSQQSMLERCQQVLNRLQEHQRDDTVIVVVFHGGLLTYLLYHLFGMPPEVGCWFEVNYGAICRLRLLPRERQLTYPPLYPAMGIEILAINDTMHLQAFSDSTIIRGSA